ncbi:MAG: hypothetical protein IPO00_08745 [Betaproteobacteria bacterium]|nr:hypothetical protein [Betaproteobacteria bacterium]
MKMKIAPTLHEWVHAMRTVYRLPGIAADGEAELRALLGAVRAGDRFFWHSVQNDPCCFTDSCGEGARYRRAKARLDRISGGKP